MSNCWKSHAAALKSYYIEIIFFKAPQYIMVSNYIVKLHWSTKRCTDCHGMGPIDTLVNVYVDLLVFTRIAGTLYTGSGRYWC